MRTSSAFNQPYTTGFNRKPAPTTSWWVGKSEAEFYDAAHKRFPESGTAQVNRDKEFTGTQIGTSLKVRGSRLRREKEHQLGYRA